MATAFPLKMTPEASIGDTQCYLCITTDTYLSLVYGRYSLTVLKVPLNPNSINSLVYILIPYLLKKHNEIKKIFYEIFQAKKFH